MKDPESPSEKAGGKLLEFPLKIKRTPLETTIWRTQIEGWKSFREQGLRLWQLWENDCASELKIEAPEDWEIRTQALERECNYLVLMAHCAQGLKLNTAPVPLLARVFAANAFESVELLIQQFGQHDPGLANKLLAIINSLLESINNYEG